MSTFEQQIEKFSKRPPAFSAREIESRWQQIKGFLSNSALEGQKTSPQDLKLYGLIAAGKITEQEYLNLCQSRYRA